MGTITAKAREKTGPRFARRSLLTAVALYVSSYGAVSAFHARNVIQEPTFGFYQSTVFRPLSWLTERSEVVQNFVHWWEFLWLS